MGVKAVLRGFGAAFFATVLVVLGVGSAASGTTSTRPGHSSHSKQAPPGIGSTLRVLNQDKQYESVKLVAVMDPAQPGDAFTTPDAGKRFVGIELQITNQSKGTDTDDANNNTSLVGSNEQVYSSDVSSIAGCTNFDNGTYTLSEGATEIGCVTFQLPDGIKIANVGYNPNSGFSTNNAVWTVGAETVSPTASGTQSGHSNHSKKAPPGIGSALRVLNQDKQYESVKLLSVMDPAQPGDSFTTPNSGKRFVGVELQITNQSTGTDSDDANNNTSVVGSNKQVYSSDVSSIAGCTNFDNGTYTLSEGATEIGCVTFEVPNGITIAKVGYNPNSGFSTNNAIWILNPPG